MREEYPILPLCKAETKPVMSKVKKPPRRFRRGGFAHNSTCNLSYFAGAGATIRSSIGLLAAVKPYISV